MDVNELGFYRMRSGNIARVDGIRKNHYHFPVFGSTLYRNESGENRWLHFQTWRADGGFYCKSDGRDGRDLVEYIGKSLKE